MDTEGSCPCCKETLETTSHVFQCAQAIAQQHRQEKLQNLERLILRSALAKPIRECFLQGLRWFLETPHTPVPPPLASTKGNIHPSEIVARNAYHSQSQLGWEQCFRGRLSKLWGEAIYFTQPGNDIAERKKQSDASVRWLIRLLLQFTTDIWKHRNEVLHGATTAEQQQKLTKLIHSKVVEAFDNYNRTPTIISYRNKYLFEKKTLLQRLQGDDDALLGWLNTVEVAITTHEIEQSTARENAARFFQPFRDAGRRRIQRRFPASKDLSKDSFHDQEIELIAPSSSSRQLQSPSSKVSEQLAAEVPPFVQAPRTATGSSIIDPTFLFSTDSDEEGSCAYTAPTGRYSTSASSSIPGPGPFPTTLLDISFSTDSSSYCPSGRRDLPIHRDSISTSSHSTISLREYKAYKNDNILPEFISFPTSSDQQESYFTASTARSLSEPTTEWSHSSPVAQSSSPGPLSSSISYSSNTSITGPRGGNSQHQLALGDSSFSGHASTIPDFLALDTENAMHSDSTTVSAVRPYSEFRDMVAFLRSQGKGSRPNRQALVVQRELLLPLSVETIGGMQQDSQSDAQSQRSPSAIPIRELDDPPDSFCDSLPSL